MSVIILGCNNPKCAYWRDGSCVLRDPHLSTYVNTVRRFDYDHNQGKLICRDCKEDK